MGKRRGQAVEKKTSGARKKGARSGALRSQNALPPLLPGLCVHRLGTYSGGFW